MASITIAKLPSVPYYAVIFTSQRTEGDNGYEYMAETMASLAAEQPGFLGLETARTPDGLGITVSYWRDPDSIKRWKENGQHLAAQKMGKEVWYNDYALRIAKVERAYGKSPNS